MTSTLRTAREWIRRRGTAGTAKGVVAAALVGLVLTGAPALAKSPTDPPLTVPQATLDANLQCDHFGHPAKVPVLLVHGTFTNGHENWDWNYRPLLRAQGFDVCSVTYPDRGMGDIQVSSQYIVNAVHRINQATGRKVAMIGHSQGGLEPRWAIKWWPSVEREVSTFVMLASPNHGTFYNGAPKTMAMPPAFHQMLPDSNFIHALNAGGEAPGAIAYTSIYSLTDELVVPASPVPTAGLDWGHTPPNVQNIAVQSVCPGRVVDHLSIIADRAVATMVLDALNHQSVTNLQRVGGAKICTGATLYIGPPAVAQMLAVFPYSFSQGFAHTTFGPEPPLAPYAR